MTKAEFHMLYTVCDRCDEYAAVHESMDFHDTFGCNEPCARPETCVVCVEVKRVLAPAAPRNDSYIEDSLGWGEVFNEA
jgi:hypothetical protein